MQFKNELRNIENAYYCLVMVLFKSTGTYLEYIQILYIYGISIHINKYSDK